MNKIFLLIGILVFFVSGCRNDSKEVVSTGNESKGHFSAVVATPKVLKNNVAIAQFFLDSAGFHGMSATITTDAVIDTDYQYTVSRVKKVLEQTKWPTELDVLAQAFITNLGLFYTALAANNVAEATILSGTIHDDQHILSHEIDTWIAATTETGVTFNLFDVSVAQFVLDSAGFHVMNESITTNQTIDATYNSIVKRAKKVLEQAIWPTELNTKAQAFIVNLGLFSVALAANDVAGATVLAGTIHDDQHDLSASIDTWLASFEPTGLEVSSFDISVAQYFLDSAGFHGMSETLTTTQAIDATYNSIVKRVKKVLTQTTWSTDLNTQAQTFIVNFGLFSTALAANNIADAVTLSDTVHDEQHELSSAIDAWVALH